MLTDDPPVSFRGSPQGLIPESIGPQAQVVEWIPGSPLTRRPGMTE